MPAVMGIGLWLILRTGKQEPSEEESTEVSSEVPEER
jgi:hypothetical protein